MLTSETSIRVLFNNLRQIAPRISTSNECMNECMYIEMYSELFSRKRHCHILSVLNLCVVRDLKKMCVFLKGIYLFHGQQVARRFFVFPDIINHKHNYRFQYMYICTYVRMYVCVYLFYVFLTPQQFTITHVIPQTSKTLSSE